MRRRRAFDLASLLAGAVLIVFGLTGAAHRGTLLFVGGAAILASVIDLRGAGASNPRGVKGPR